MTDLLDKAFSRIRSLPHHMQDEMARVLLRMAGEEGSIYVLSDEEHTGLAAAEKEIGRGELATDAEIEAVFGKSRM